MTAPQAFTNDSLLRPPRLSTNNDTSPPSISYPNDRSRVAGPQRMAWMAE